jgi:superfamily I DNA/RNA helicase
MDLEAHLNPKVLKIWGPPGVGKTFELLRLFEEELKTTPVEKIAFCTFTRSAKKVVLERCGKTQEEAQFLRTIHSMCYRQLGLQNGQLVGKKDLKYFGKVIGVPIVGLSHDPWAEEELGESAAGQLATKADVLLNLNHLGRHRQTGLKEAFREVELPDLDYEYAKWFTQEYRAWKTRECMLDYTDLLTQYLEVGEPLPVDVLFCDEAQDCSKLQWEVIHKMSANAKKLYLAGDDDQEIFSFCGASAQAFIDEPCTDQKFLEQSYRLPRRVLQQAIEISAKIQHRQVKRIIPRNAEGSCREVEYLSPNLFHHGGSSFVLFRNHHRGHYLAVQLEELAIPFKGSHAILELSSTQNLLHAWKKILHDPHDQLTPTEAKAIVDAANPERLRPEARDLARNACEVSQLFYRVPGGQEWPTVLTQLPKIGYVTQCLREHGWERTLRPPVTLLSIHQAKGQQADRVVLDPVLARKTFDGLYKDPDAEHRVFYVAATRAKYDLLWLQPEDALAYER